MILALKNNEENDLKKIFFLITIIFFIYNLIIGTLIISPCEHFYSDMQGYLERGFRLSNFSKNHPFDVFYPPGTNYIYAIIFLIFGLKIGLLIIPIGRL